MVIHNPILTGSFTVNNIDVSSITSSAANITALNAATASLNSFSASVLSYTASQNILNGTYTLTSSFAAQTASFTAFTASILAQTASLNSFSSSVLTFTGSAATRLGALESYTSSLNNKTSSFATTGSNAFIGTQTITGSVLQSGSFTSTGTLTAQTLVVQTITSSVVYSSGSNIFGNTIGNSQTFTGSVLVTGSLTIAGGSSATSYSGATIYGSTAVCSPVGKFTTCIDVGGTGTFSGQLTATTVNGGTSAIFINSGVQNSNGIEIRGGTSATAVNWKLEKDNTLSNAFQITPSTTNGGSTYTTPSFTLTSAGIACFSGQVCGNGATFVCSVGTTALNMNNMASLGSISGGSIYLPYTAGLFFRSADGSTAKGKIQADNCNNLLLNSDNAGKVAIGTTSPGALLDISYNGQGLGQGLRISNTNVAGQIYEFSVGKRAVNNNDFILFNATTSSTLLLFDPSGIACFISTVCTPNIIGTNLTTTNSICLSGVGSLCFFGNGESKIQGPGTGAYIGLYNIGTIQFNSSNTYDIGSSATTARCVFSTKVSATQLLATCLTLNSFSSGNGFKMDYGSASGQITAINLIANGTTNGFIGIQMVDGSNGDLWLGGSAGRSMTLYRTGNTGLKTDTPCTSIHVEGGYGSRWGGNGCFFGGGISGGGMPYGDIYGNGASYTYQTCCGNANNSSLYGGFAAGYFKGGPGSSYGGGGAGIVAIGGDGGNAESVNAGGGAGIFARAGKNGAGSAHSYAGWFDGGDVMIRCGSVLSCAPNNGYNFRALGFSTGAIATGGSCLIYSSLDRGLYLISIASSVTSTFGYSAFLWVDSSNITASSVIRQSCVTISTSGRALCVVNQYTSETAIMTVTTLNLLNYIG